MSDTNVKDIVKEKYGQAALRAKSGGSSCCGADSIFRMRDPITSNLYDTHLQTDGIPEEACLASLGCGNPTALTKLNPGEIVLDLGSGGGIDVSAFSQTRGAGWKSFRAGHDRRNARPGQRK